MGLAPSADAQRALAHLSRIEAAHTDRQRRGADPRTFKRFAIRGEALVRPAGRHAQLDTKLEVHLRDVSRGGIGFICDQPLPKGSLWVVSVVREEVVLEEMTVRVRFSRPIDGGCHLIGGMFLASDRTLMLLGVEAQEIDRSEDSGQCPDNSAGDFSLPENL